jgi:hypothetical protein
MLTCKRLFSGFVFESTKGLRRTASARTGLAKRLLTIAIRASSEVMGLDIVEETNQALKLERMENSRKETEYFIEVRVANLDVSHATDAALPPVLLDSSFRSLILSPSMIMHQPVPTSTVATYESRFRGARDESK